MSRKTFRKSDIRSLNVQLCADYGDAAVISPKSNVVRVDEKKYSILIVDDSVDYLLVDGHWIPTLKHLLRHRILPAMTVDMGAVRHIAGGADVMRPGVTSIDEGIASGDVVVVVDEKNNTALAVARAMGDSEWMRAQSDGKIAANLHHVGDRVWNAG